MNDAEREIAKEYIKKKRGEIKDIAPRELIHQNTKFYDKKLTACGDKVVLRRIEKEHEIIKDGIILPEIVNKGFCMSKARVESIGPDCPNEGLKVGDIVMYDTYSSYELTHPICVIKYENLIGLWEENVE